MQTSRRRTPLVPLALGEQDDSLEDPVPRHLQLEVDQVHELLRLDEVGGGPRGVRVLPGVRVVVTPPRRVDAPGAHGRHADPGAARLVGDAVQEADHAVLARDVAALCGDAPGARHGGHPEDVAAVLRHHGLPQDGMRHIHGSLEVDINERVDVRSLQLPELLPVMWNGRIVDQHVDRAVLLKDTGDHRCDLCLVADVAWVRQGVRAAGGADRLQLLLAPGDRGDLPALGGEVADQVLPHAARGARHEHDLWPTAGHVLLLPLRHGSEPDAPAGGTARGSA
eukprot:CAMPEP_0204604824 /NCGR_PEP_ID=MMETSP0661-20131031/58110_1 /ASSEMBLY_ACC=CAM_ASM_000606 /TAXON_ID=109239 /ORGANISM="Alexandrium margalefi, Strain AMGDE01CS-322" /LENGTH=280 /DNA_ID=CAMNT_0051616015 /DNA_START=124 /DNA_END=963 /DNA_ORIENTATION=+